MTDQKELLRLLHLMTDGVEGYWAEHGYLRYWREADVLAALRHLESYRTSSAGGDVTPAE